MSASLAETCKLLSLVLRSKLTPAILLSVGAGFFNITDIVTICSSVLVTKLVLSAKSSTERGPSAIEGTIAKERTKVIASSIDIIFFFI